MHTPPASVNGAATITNLGTLDLEQVVALIRSKLGRELPQPSPRDTRTLHLIEATRAEVSAAVQDLVCVEQAHNILAAPIRTWNDAERATAHTTPLLIEVLTKHTCPHAPVAAGLVVGWDGLILAAINFHNGTASFRDVTDRAETIQRLARFYYRGAFRAAIGGI